MVEEPPVAAAPRPPVVVVGEDNPFGKDPRYALYHEPENSAGGRLRRLVMGLRVVSYHRYTVRYNLCAGKWSSKEAFSSASRLLETHPAPPNTLVLLGAKVCRAFCVDYAPFTLHDYGVILPHPSGRCRAWNNLGAFHVARRLLREARPDVPWGNIDETVKWVVKCSNCGLPTVESVCSDCGFDQGGGNRVEVAER